MRKLCTIVIATLLLFAFSLPAWAGSKNGQNDKGKKEVSLTYFMLVRERIHQLRTNQQFNALKHRYEKSNADAQQMFLEYLGTSIPAAEEQIQTLKDEYEQMVAERDSTIAALQLQLDALDTQKNAECDARLAQEQEAWQTSLQQQLNDLNAAHQVEMNNLTIQLEAECNTRLEEASVDWEASCQNQCADSGSLAQVSVLNTGSVNPYAIDTDSSGNIFVLDRDGGSVTELDAAGTQIGQWSPGSLVLPSDIAVDSQRNVYVADKQANVTLQKFGADGTPMPFDTGSTTIVYPSGLYIDSSDQLYVTDYGGAYGGRVLVFDTSGNLINAFGEVDALAFDEYNDVVVDETGQAIYVVTNSLVGSFDLTGLFQGSWAGDFYRPFGIAAGTNGDIFVADTYNDEVDQYDSAGNLISSFAQDTYRPFRIITDANGRLYVADHGNMEIEIYE